MTWRNYLYTKTRHPEFLWRMVIGILVTGIGLGFVAQQVWQPGANQADEQASEQEVTKDGAVKQLDSLAEQGEWGRLWWALPRVVYRRFDMLGPVILAAVAGCCWMIFLWQALQTPGWRDLRLWCILLAIPLGSLSIWPTHFLNFWQKHVWNLHESRELIPGIRYFVLSVGLREEFAKLLCVLPLMPILLRMRSELSALLVSACVGLGFAMTENIGYFAGTGSTAALVRFLMANPFHMASTGLLGLALYRTLHNPRGWASHSLGIFGILVFAHGLYDAFIALPALSEYSLLTTIIFALVIYQFFHELRELRPTQGDTVSLSANFLCGVSVLTAATFVYLSATFGISMAFDSLAAGVLSQAVMVYLFLREMPESMIGV